MKRIPAGPKAGGAGSYQKKSWITSTTWPL